MLLPFPAIDAAFKAASPRDVAILFLIEDSSAMGLLWPRLRDFYLPKVLAAIKDANPSVTIQVLWMPTSQLSLVDSRSGSSGRRSRRWNEIPTFSFTQNFKISVTAVSRAIDALSSEFGTTKALRHLVVVAASEPTSDFLNRSSMSWFPVVHKLQQEDTRLHMIVTSQHKMDSLTALFWETFKKDISKASVTDDTHYVFYLRNETDHAAQSAPIPPLEISAKSPETTSSSPSPTKSSTASKPSLVFQLQKMNGMEKKRRSRARRDPLITTRPSRPYQKSNFEVSRTGEASNSRAESPVRSDHRKSSRTIDEVVGGVYDAHSRSVSSEDTTSYSSATSPARSLSPCSPTYPRLASSPLTGSQWLPSEHSSPHSGSLAMSHGTYSSLQRSPVSSLDLPSLNPASYQALPSYRTVMPVGPIRSHYPTDHHVNQRRPHLQTHGSNYSDTGSWQQPQRDPRNVVDYSFQHNQPSFAPAVDSPETQRPDAPLSQHYLSHGHGHTYTEVADVSAFYSDYDHNTQCYEPHNYEVAHAEQTPYSFPMHSSSSLHPSPISFVP